MGLKKLNRLTPVMMNDIVAGQTYIRVIVNVYGWMRLSYQVFCGRAFRDKAILMGVWWINCHEDGRAVRSLSLIDMGMDPTCFHNEHRTFRYTGKNEQKLKDLVERQALAEYLTLIGYSDPVYEISKIKVQGEEYRRFARMLDNMNYVSDDLSL